MHLQEFHLNIKYNKGNTNHVTDYPSRPSIVSRTIILNSYGNEMFGWPQLYNCDFEFSTTYQTLSTEKPVPNFHLQDGLICHMSHLCIPSSEHEKIIWESHYSHIVGHFGVEQTVVVLQKNFYWTKLQQDVCKYIGSCTTCTISKPSIKKIWLYTHLSKEHTQPGKPFTLCF